MLAKRKTIIMHSTTFRPDVSHGRDGKRRLCEIDIFNINKSICKYVSTELYVEVFYRMPSTGKDPDRSRSGR